MSAENSPQIMLSERLGGRRTTSLLLWGLSGIGYALCLQVLLAHGIAMAGGGGGIDVVAYWNAGANVMAGMPVYGSGVGGDVAYLYPPPLAQVFAPLSLLPFPTAAWLWRGVELIALRVAVGSWRSGGIALLLWPPVIAELDAGNVHLLIAAAVAQAIRSDARLVVPAALTKFASLAAVPLALKVDRRGLAFGVVVAGAICAVSFALAPSLWFEYVTFWMGGIPTADSGWYNLSATLPVVPRAALAIVVSVLAIRWARLAGVAATIALPVLWFHGLSVLVAVAARPGRAGTSPSSSTGTTGVAPLVPVTGRTTSP